MTDWNNIMIFKDSVACGMHIEKKFRDFWQFLLFL